MFKLPNPYLGDSSHLYHLGLLTTDQLQERFHDVKYVCMGGKPERMREFAEVMYECLGKPERCEFNECGKPDLKDIAEEAGRYAMFKVGPILSVSHGIGMASISVVLHELFKLLHYAKASNDVKFFRIGTSGGLGVEEGTIVITKQTYNALLEPIFKQVSCGKLHEHDSSTDEQLTKELLIHGKNAKLKVVIGNTLTTDDFFEGQARLDGAFCDFTESDKISFMKKAHDEYGVRNFEMESTCFAAMCRRAGLKCGIACVCVVNRQLHDDVTADHDLLHLWQEHLYELMKEYLTKDITNNN